MASVRTNTGRRLNELWRVNARHALYHKDGLWYEKLERFPGALFDQNGYIVFETEEAFAQCPDIKIKQKVAVPNGIARIPNYQLMNAAALAPIRSDAIDVTEDFEEGGEKIQLHMRKERNRKAVIRKKEQFLAHHGRLGCEACDFDFLEVYGLLGTGFAECHHRVPLAKLEENHRTRLSELAIVCANCHRMLHKSRPMLTVDQLREVVMQRQQAYLSINNQNDNKIN